MVECSFSKINRILYITEGGELFVQFRPGKENELMKLNRQLYEGKHVVYVESLASGHVINGTISRVTKSGIALKDWTIKG